MDKVSDTPMTDAAVHTTKLLRRADGTFAEAVDAVTCRQFERELAGQKEQFRVLEDELLVLGDERNAAVSELEIYRQREADIFKALTAVIT